MPITKSAIKKSRQDVKAREHNRLLRDDYKKAVKEVKKLVASGDSKKAQTALRDAYSKLDVAAKKNILHKNNASRRKSRLSMLLVKDTKKKTTEKTEVNKTTKVTPKKEPKAKKIL